MQISETPTLVGRGSHVGIVIDDPSVSSTHAELVRRGGVVWVRDLASTNGTWVNSQRVTGEVMVPDGAVVQFGLIAYTLHGGGISENAPEPAQTMIVNRSVALLQQVPPLPFPCRPPRRCSLLTGCMTPATGHRLQKLVMCQRRWRSGCEWF